MGWGSIIGGVLGGDGGSAIGSIYDLWRSSRDQDEAQDRYDDALDLQSGLARDEAAYTQQIRDRLRDRTDELDATLRAVFTALGARDPISQTDLFRDTENLRRQYTDQVDRTINLVNSQGYANNLTRGLGDSTVESDRRIVTVNQYAPAYMDAENRAVSDAISRASARSEMLTRDRASIIGEYLDVLSPGQQGDLAEWQGNAASSAGRRNAVGAYLDSTGAGLSGTTEANAEAWRAFETNSVPYLQRLFGYTEDDE